MKNTIMYYYDLEPRDIRQKDKIIYFEIDGTKYYFIPCDRPIEELKSLVKLNTEMIRRNILVHEIVLNNKKDIITMYNDLPYVMLKIDINDKGIFVLGDLSNMSLMTKDIEHDLILEKSNWGSLWSNKIDYFEYQISQFGNKYPIINSSFSYFVGMAENAISYVNDTIREIKPTVLDSKVVGHKRISYSFDLLQFYNPLTLVVDHKARDLAEYIKVAFFKNNLSWDSLEEYFKYNNFSLYGYSLLFGRLLFPTFYFDVYEDIINNGIKEAELVHVIDRVKEYEDFLFDMYYFIKKRAPIKEVSWLVNRH